MANPLYPAASTPLIKTYRRKINSLARRLSSIRAPAYPIFAWITPTTRCNLRCITCARTVNPDWKSRDLDPAVYEIVRREILPRLICVELSGTGEPLLAPIFTTIFEDVLRHKIEYSVTTNLTIMPDENLLNEMLHSTGTIMISLDGTDEATMTHIRPGLNYAVFIHNLERVSGMKRQVNNPGFSLRFNFVITRSNVEQMPELIEMAARYGVGSVYFSSFLVGLRTDSFIGESLFEEPDVVKPHLIKALKIAQQRNIHVSPPVFRQHAGKAFNPMEDQTQKEQGLEKIGQCPHPWWSVYIDVDGTIMPCCVFGVPFGNLREQSFKKIWNGPIYRHFRSLVNTPQMPEGCKHCPLNVRL